MKYIDGHFIPDEGPVILAANHFSYMDTVFYPAVVPRQIHFLSKIELFKGTFLNKTFNALGQIPVVRGAGDRNAFKLAIEALSEGKIVGIFPEGTNTRDGKLLKAHTGVARLAMLTGLPITPMGGIGTYTALPRGQFLPTFCPVSVKVGKPIPVEKIPEEEITVQGARELTYRVMVEIAELIGETDGRYVRDDQERFEQFVNPPDEKLST